MFKRFEEGEPYWTAGRKDFDVDLVEGWTHTRGPFDAADPNLDNLMRRLQEESPRCRVEGHVLGPTDTAEAHIWRLDHGPVAEGGNRP